jgi:hypothetical protein
MKTFISYRREDSRHVADRIYDRLAAHFGKETVFKDVDSIPLGVDFRRKLQEAVAQCSVMVVVIGDHWLTLTDKTGQRRLDDENDFVRIEIETALQRRIVVVPILVDGARMPSTNDLPPSLGELTFQQGTTIRADPDFHRDLDRLTVALETHGIKPQPMARPDLEIVSVRRTRDFELDVTLRNIGSEPAVIYQIDLTLVKEGTACAPVIRPSAKYDMPIGNLRVGETRSLPVSHYVKPHAVDRFKIALHTTRSLLLRLTLHYNKNQKVEAPANT